MVAVGVAGGGELTFENAEGLVPGLFAGGGEDPTAKRETVEAAGYRGGIADAHPLEQPALPRKRRVSGQRLEHLIEIEQLHEKACIPRSVGRIIVYLPRDRTCQSSRLRAGRGKRGRDGNP